MFIDLLTQYTHFNIHESVITFDVNNVSYVIFNDDFVT